MKFEELLDKIAENLVFRDIFYICVIMVMAIFILSTSIEVVEPESLKERTERHISTCENWEVCDYMPDFLCPGVGTRCLDKYRCNWEPRNCINPTNETYINVNVVEHVGIV